MAFYWLVPILRTIKLEIKKDRASIIFSKSEKMGAKTIYKNYLVMSLSFSMLFVSFNGTQTLQRQAFFGTQSLICY